VNNHSAARPVSSARTVKAGVVGFRGYSGAELVSILARHPQVEPVLVEHREKDEGPRRIGEAGPKRIACSGEAVRSAAVEVVFLATPADVSMELAPVMLAAGAKVIDLSGAFRLGTKENFEHWYKESHTQPELLAEAAYGLPEFCRERIKEARLVANPGCYPTAANLAIRPLIEADVVERGAGIVCDAKSGVSGAGRKASLSNSFCEVTENFSAYSILNHRHVPEVLRTSGLEESELSFTAQLLPVDRGILETIYFRAKNGASADDLMGVYARRYSLEPFVRLYRAGHVPDLRRVQRTNFCDLGVRLDSKTGRGVVVAAIDNLVKGAAGQAVQNMNLMFDFEETAGL
jgi:N-acetyl-gamma-glutamyl-phosphate reductase